jgi:hypothetical protein
MEEVDLSDLQNVQTQLANASTIQSTTSTSNATGPKPQAIQDTMLEENVSSLRFGTKRMKNVILIKQYEIAFPAIVKPLLEQIQVDALGEEDSEGLLKEIRLAVCCKNGLRFSPQLAEAFLTTLEGIIVEFTPYKVQGLSAVARDPEYIDVCNEVLLELGGLTYVNPFIRLALLTLKHAYIIHQINSRVMQTQNLEREVQEAVAQLSTSSTQ